MIGLCLNIADINTSSERPVPTNISFINYDELNSKLRLETWNEIYASNCISVAYSLFINKLNSYIEQSTHTRVLPAQQIKRIKPWIGNDLLQKIHLKNKLGLKCRKHPNNLPLKLRYKNLSHAIKKEIPLARENFYRSKLQNCARDVKKQWSLINEITCKPAKSNNPISLSIDNVTVSDNNDVANEFNKYFSTIASSLNVDSAATGISQIARDSSVPNSFFYENITPFEVIQIINSLDNSNACGIDKISNKLLKNIVYNVAHILAYLFNLSVETGVFPNELKSAVVIPLYKKGDRDKKENYRPISLLSSISKIFEKAMKKRIVAFLIVNNFFNPKQFGFRSGLSTEDALLHFYSSIIKGLDDKKFSSALFIDIRGRWGNSGRIFSAAYSGA